MFECVLFVAPSGFSAFKKADKTGGLDIDAYSSSDNEPVGFSGYSTRQCYDIDERGRKPPIKIRVTIEEIE